MDCIVWWNQTNDISRAREREEIFMFTDKPITNCNDKKKSIGKEKNERKLKLQMKKLNPV